MPYAKPCRTCTNRSPQPFRLLSSSTPSSSPSAPLSRGSSHPSSTRPNHSLRHAVTSSKPFFSHSSYHFSHTSQPPMFSGRPPSPCSRAGAPRFRYDSRGLGSSPNSSIYSDLSSLRSLTLPIDRVQTQSELSYILWSVLWSVHGAERFLSHWTGIGPGRCVPPTHVFSLFNFLFVAGVAFDPRLRCDIRPRIGFACGLLCFLRLPPSPNRHSSHPGTRKCEKGLRS